MRPHAPLLALVAALTVAAPARSQDALVDDTIAETVQPDTEQPDTEQPDTEQPDTVQPETAQPETAAGQDTTPSGDAADVTDPAESPVPEPPARPVDEERIGEDESAEAAPSDTVPLRERGAADAAWATCLSTPPGDVDGMRACLERVTASFPGTPAALRAEGAIAALARVAPSEGQDGLRIPPGRLELSSTAGLFGIWNGIAAGVAVAAHVPDVPAEAMILGTGALALGLGVGYGIGGYYLADALNLGEGDSRLVASSLVWGTTFGIAAIPALFETNLQGGLAVSLPIATVVLGGFVGGGVALGLTQVTELSSAEVSLINTGGWLGALFGLLSIPNLAAWQVESPAAYSAAYIGLGALGLAGGAIASQLLDFTWGEVLLLDLGGVLGLVAGGTVVFSLNAAGAFATLPGNVAAPLITGALGLGALAGVAATGAGIALFRGAEQPVFRLGDATVEAVLGAPMVVLDTARQPVLIAPGPAFRF